MISLAQWLRRTVDRLTLKRQSSCIRPASGLGKGSSAALRSLPSEVIRGSSSDEPARQRRARSEDPWLNPGDASIRRDAWVRAALLHFSVILGQAGAPAPSAIRGSMARPGRCIYPSRWSLIRAMSIVCHDPSPAPVCARPRGRTCARRWKKELHAAATIAKPDAILLGRIQASLQWVGETLAVLHRFWVRAAASAVLLRHPRANSGASRCRDPRIHPDF